ncbi:MAG: ferredoxin reductase family protein [Patescibacteria group bacterium]
MIGELLITIGRWCGLVAFVMFLVQLLLIGRISWIERIWGHDRLSRWHHVNGIVAWSILVLHPVFLSLGYSELASTTPIRQLIFFITDYPAVLRAFIGYLLFLMIVPISLTIVRKRLRYEWWYGIHLLLYVAILLSFGHQVLNGQDLQSPFMHRLWLTLLFGTLGLVLWFRLLAPLVRFRHYSFRVSRIERETHDVISIYISSKNFKAQPGQFVIVRFLAKNFWWEAHPFTISHATDDYLRITPKAVGDFTAKLPTLPIGTRVFVEGPLGRFTPDRAGNKPVLLIAGGIGITPIHMLFEKFPTAPLIYTARSDQDFALQDELDAIGHVSYTTERLTPDLIKSIAPDVATRFVYLCGPPPMMKAVREQLRQLGVPKHNILYEKFQLG